MPGSFQLEITPFCDIHESPMHFAGYENVKCEEGGVILYGHVEPIWSCEAPGCRRRYRPGFGYRDRQQTNENKGILVECPDHPVVMALVEVQAERLQLHCPVKGCGRTAERSKLAQNAQ